MQTSIATLMNRRRILCWKGWQMQGYIRKGNILLDYGCGKGRVDFFLSYQTRCKSIGIEYDERIYEKAAENKKDAVSSGRVEIETCECGRICSTGDGRLYVLF